MLAANYRHGKFSSFQRQLNMYGFRKVADCSDRTYSHPYFRRDKPELLAHVRRVVNDPLGTANANASLNADGNPVALTLEPKSGAGGGGGDGGGGRAGGLKCPLVVPVPATAAPKEEEKEGKLGGGSGGGSGAGAGAGAGIAAGDEQQRVGPARKKPRRLVGGVLTSSASSGLTFSPPCPKPKQVSVTASIGGASRGHGSRNSSPVFPYPSQRQAAAGGGGGATTAQHQHQHQRHPSSWSQQHQRHQQQQQLQVRRLHEQEKILQAACSAAASAGKPNPSRQQFSSSMWHQHTGRWGGETTLMTGTVGGVGGGGNGGSSLAEDGGAWTTSSSASSSVDDVSSPVLLPISPADLDCSGYVPPFRLQPDASTRLPDTRRSRSSISGNKLPVPVSPAPGSMSSAAALFGGGGRGGGMTDGWSGGLAASGASAQGQGAPYARSSSSVLYSEMTTTTTTTQHMPGLYGGAIKGGINSDGGVGGDAGRPASASAGSAIDESNTLSLDKAFVFGSALSRPASFDLSLDRQEASSPRTDSESGHVKPCNFLLTVLPRTVVSTYIQGRFVSSLRP